MSEMILIKKDINIPAVKKLLKSVLLFDNDTVVINL